MDTVTDSLKTRAHLFVSGHVQGVGYRAFVGRQAELHGLTGWVKNVIDGRVESEAQGAKEAIESFVQDLNRGPNWSKVDQVTIEWLLPNESETNFEIIY
jgi:acylphosphatase